MTAEQRERIRVLFPLNPPETYDDCAHFPTLQPSLHCPYPGWCSEIVSHLADYLHYEIESVVVRNRVGETQWGLYNRTTATWDGALGAIYNGSVDTACLFFQATYLRMRDFRFSYPVAYVRPIYVVRGRDMDISLGTWNAFTPYAASTWLVMLAVFLIQTLYCIAVAKVETNLGLRRYFNPYQVAWKLVRFQLVQPTPFDCATRAGNFAMLVFTLMQCRLLLDMYHALLLSALLQPSSENPFADAREMIRMVAAQRYHLVTNYAGNWYFESLHDSNLSHYRTLRAATASNPVQLAPSATAALERVHTGNYIYPIQEDSVSMLLAHRYCGMVYVREGMPEMSSHFLFHKNATALVRQWNGAIIRNQDFIRRTFRKYLREGFRIDRGKWLCHATEERPSDGLVTLRPLGMYSLFGVVLVMLIGLSLAGLALFIEIYYTWHRRMVQLQLRTRRAMAEPIHLMGLARLFAGPEVQRRVDEQLRKRTIHEIHLQYGEYHYF